MLAGMNTVHHPGCVSLGWVIGWFVAWGRRDRALKG
jgi:hypothetical protein